MPGAVRTIALCRLAVVAMVAIVGCGAPASSGQPASPRISCVGVPAARCDEAVASVARSLPNTGPVSIEISCATGSCTVEAGAMDTVVTLADGSQLRSATVSWANGDGVGSGGGAAVPPPAPVLPPAVPVEPRCQGVPASMCGTMAETAFGDVSNEGVVRIVVRCGEQPCTDQHGVGDTVVTYSNGTMLTSTWEYEGN